MIIKVNYSVTDIYMSTSVSPVYVKVVYSGNAAVAGVWGTITGTLSAQTDLQNALNAKVPTSRILTINGVAFDLSQNRAWTIDALPSQTGNSGKYLTTNGSVASWGTINLSGYVPYTGATTNVDLGEFELKAGQLSLDVSPTGTAAVGTTQWNNTIGASETTLKGGSVVLKNGVDLVARVVNKVTPNATLTKAAYQAVRVSGAQGQRLEVAYAQANNDANSAETIGLVCETIATNQEGFILTMGQLENINTTGSLQGETWVDGDVLYLSPFTAGAVTKVKPTGAGHIVVIGYVEYAHVNNGKIYVKVMNGWELDELHDVSIVSAANNEALIYESSTQLWKNKTIASALGFTPVPTSRTLTINGTTYDLSADRSWTIAAGITGSGVANQLTYWNGTGSVTGNVGLTYNDTTQLLSATNLKLNTTAYSDVNASLIVGSSTSAKGIVASSSTYQDFWFVNTSISSGNINSWNFGQRRDTYFGNTIGSFQIVGAYTDNTGVSSMVGSGFRVPMICNPNGDIILAGAINAINGNVGIGISPNPSYKLDVNGATRISDTILVTKNSNANLQIQVSNTTSGSVSQSSYSLVSNTTSGNATFGKFSSGTTAYKTIASSDAYLYNAIGGDISILNDFASGKIKFASGGSSTAQMTLTAAGRLLLGTTTESTNILDVNGTARVSGDITINSMIFGTRGATWSTFIGQSISSTSNYSVGIGYQALSVSTGQNNTAIGIQAGKSITSGTNNLAIGPQALFSCTTASSNVATGQGAGQNATGAFNCLYGTGSGFNLTTGAYNTFIGTQKGLQANNNGITTGNYNTIIGAVDGLLTTLSNNVILADGQGNLRLVFDSNGNAYFGASTTYPTINSSAILQADSTTKGFLPPRMTTTQKNAISSPAAGLQVYDTTLSQMSYYNGTTWVNF